MIYTIWLKGEVGFLAATTANYHSLEAALRGIREIELEEPRLWNEMVAVKSGDKQ